MNGPIVFRMNANEAFAYFEELEQNDEVISGDIYILPPTGERNTTDEDFDHENGCDYNKLSRQQLLARSSVKVSFELLLRRIVEPLPYRGV